MALAIEQVYARSTHRIRAIFSGGNPSSLVPSNFSLARTDGGPNATKIGAVVAADAASLDLCTDAALIAGVFYSVTYSAKTLSFKYTTPASLDSSLVTPDDDPEAEAFGIELQWLFTEPTPTGDCPRLSGRACIEYDLPNRGFTMKGELVHLPGVGGNLPQTVNGPNDLGTLGELASTVEDDWRDDDRLADVEADVATDSNFDTHLNGRVTPIATGLPLELRST